MSNQNQDPIHNNQKHKSPETPDTFKQQERQKAEQLEVAGKHKNDGQKNNKGSR